MNDLDFPDSSFLDSSAIQSNHQFFTRFPWEILWEWFQGISGQFWGDRSGNNWFRVWLGPLNPRRVGKPIEPKFVATGLGCWILRSSSWEGSGGLQGLEAMARSLLGEHC